MRMLFGRRKFLAAGLLALVLSSPARPARAAGFDSSDWDRVLKGYVADERVDYQKLKAHPQELRKFLKEIASLQESEYAAWSRGGQIAFWINAYNALTIQAILDRYPIQPSFLASLRFPKNSIRQIPGVWDKLEFRVLGREWTLGGIEDTLRSLGDPRIHMAIVCASKGCPPLRGEAYAGPRLEAQLDDQAAAFLRTPSKFRIDRAPNRVYLSPIFKWFGGDFLKAYSPAQGFEGRPAAERAVLNFISRHVDARDAEYLRRGDFTVDYLSYDWSLNEKGAP